jgi:DNA-binding transcriptional ArsR family regulator
MSPRRRSSSTRARPRDAAALRNAVPIFAALGDATRLHIIGLLCAGGALSIAEVTSGTNLTRQAIAKHLRVLADAGLVRDVKAGRERLWECERAQLEQARRSLQLIEQQWDDALMRLKAAVEGR